MSGRNQNNSNSEDDYLHIGDSIQLLLAPYIHNPHHVGDDNRGNIENGDDDGGGDDEYFNHNTPNQTANQPPFANSQSSQTPPYQTNSVWLWTKRNGNIDQCTPEYPFISSKVVLYKWGASLLAKCMLYYHREVMEWRPLVDAILVHLPPLKGAHTSNASQNLIAIVYNVLTASVVTSHCPHCSMSQQACRCANITMMTPQPTTTTTTTTPRYNADNNPALCLHVHVSSDLGVDKDLSQSDTQKTPGDDCHKYKWIIGWDIGAFTQTCLRTGLPIQHTLTKYLKYFDPSPSITPDNASVHQQGRGNTATHQSPTTQSETQHDESINTIGLDADEDVTSAVDHPPPPPPFWQHQGFSCPGWGGDMSCVVSSISCMMSSICTMAYERFGKTADEAVGYNVFRWWRENREILRDAQWKSMLALHSIIINVCEVWCTYLRHTLKEYKHTIATNALTIRDSIINALTAGKPPNLVQVSQFICARYDRYKELLKVILIIDTLEKTQLSHTIDSIIKQKLLIQNIQDECATDSFDDHLKPRIVHLIQTAHPMLIGLAQLSPLTYREFTSSLSPHFHLMETSAVCDGFDNNTDNLDGQIDHLLLQQSNWGGSGTKQFYHSNGSTGTVEKPSADMGPNLGADDLLRACVARWRALESIFSNMDRLPIFYEALSWIA